MFQNDSYWHLSDTNKKYSSTFIKTKNDFMKGVISHHNSANFFQTDDK